MALAGWLIMIAGIAWMFLKLFMEFSATKKASSAATKDPDKPGAEAVVPLKDMIELAKTTYGPGLVLVIVGALLIAADSGTTLQFGGGVTPSPSPSP